MKRMKLILTVGLMAVLMGCAPAAPEEKVVRSQNKSTFYTQYIKRNSYDVCVRGVKHIYINNGNASQVVVLLDPQTSRVTACDEVSQ